MADIVEREAVLAGRWPVETDVVILPRSETLPTGEQLFAPGALDLGDELESLGLTVAYAGDPQHVLILESWEWWGPAVLIAQDAIASGVGEALARAVFMAIERRRGERGTPGTAHMRLNIYRDKQVEARELQYDGPAEDLPDMIRAFVAQADGERPASG
jgi:hypothetical protein